MAEPRWKIPLTWHGSACVARVIEVSRDTLRAVVSVTVPMLAVVLMVGTAAVSQRDAGTLAVGSFSYLPDSVSLLRSRDAAETMSGVDALLWTLRPAALLTGSLSDASDRLNAEVQRLAATPSIMPTQGWLSSRFTRRRLHPLLHVFRPHEGIDVRAPRGTPIEAPGEGTVVKAGWEQGYGWTIEIDHGYGIVTRYAHTAKILVELGQRVERGEVIARVGATGLAEAPHLHYEVRQNGRPVDPLRFVLPAVLAD